jgi:hypothetical protein
MCRWLGRWWRKRQRDRDRQRLFPLLRGQRDPLAGARAIRLHIATARAWRYTEEWAGEAMTGEERLPSPPRPTEEPRAS